MWTSFLSSIADDLKYITDEVTVQTVTVERPLHCSYCGKIPERAVNKANIVSACDICGSVAYINGLVPYAPIYSFFNAVWESMQLLSECFCTVMCCEHEELV